MDHYFFKIIVLVVILLNVVNTNPINEEVNINNNGVINNEEDNNIMDESNKDNALRIVVAPGTVQQTQPQQQQQPSPNIYAYADVPQSKPISLVEKGKKPIGLIYLRKPINIIPPIKQHKELIQGSSSNVYQTYQNPHQPVFVHPGRNHAKRNILHPYHQLLQQQQQQAVQHQQPSVFQYQPQPRPYDPTYKAQPRPYQYLTQEQQQPEETLHHFVPAEYESPYTSFAGVDYNTPYANFHHEAPRLPGPRVSYTPLPQPLAAIAKLYNFFVTSTDNMMTTLKFLFF